MLKNIKPSNAELLDNVMHRVLIPIALFYMVWILGTKVDNNNPEIDKQTSDPITAVLEV